MAMNEELHGLSSEAISMGVLILKHVKEEIDPQEKLLLDAWIAKSEKNKTFFDELVQHDMLHDRLKYFYKAEERKAAATEKMMQQLFPQVAEVKQMSNRWRTMFAAAAILLLVAVGAYLWIVRSSKQRLAKTEKNDERFIKDIAPGKNGAILKLDNGREIILDSAANGLLTQQGSSKVVKNDGQLTYSGSSSAIDEKGQAEITYNTLTTPRGRQFHVVLPDGSNVWLNAASSIRFPVAFTGSERKVEITGEVYFEIVPLTRPGQGKIPFKAVVYTTPNSTGMEVEVIGTHFNINAYHDEPAIRTTLLEGSVRVINRQSVPQGRNNDKPLLLKPGEQAIAFAHSPLTIDHSADVEQVMAWKNGSFYFQDAQLETIMRQLARWYDVEIVYEDQKPDVQLVYAISRDTDLSEVLKVLEMGGGVRFKVEGKKIIVLSP
jgi:ferric-dicitrate binding protein FerR (iron transport regulator)